MNRIDIGKNKVKYAKGLKDLSDETLCNIIGISRKDNGGNGCERVYITNCVDGDNRQKKKIRKNHYSVTKKSRDLNKFLSSNLSNNTDSFSISKPTHKYNYSKIKGKKHPHVSIREKRKGICTEIQNCDNTGEILEFDNISEPDDISDSDDTFKKCVCDNALRLFIFVYMIHIGGIIVAYSLAPYLSFFTYD